jgi:hypothetical protein
MIAKGDLRYPHGTEQMSPFRRVCLLEGTIGIGAEYARLEIVSIWYIKWRINANLLVRHAQSAGISGTAIGLRG